MDRLPVVAIVGRPNVGKSSLLNALVGKRISIVQDMPGVTRDRISTPLKVPDDPEHPDGPGRYVELVDTGGYGFVDPDQLTDHIRLQIEHAMSVADLVLFVVDAQAGRTSADEEIAGMLRHKGLKTVLLANKADGPKADVMLGDFARLGLGTPVGVSALNDRNTDQILAAVAANVDLSNAPTEVPPPQMLVAIVGKRNAGKSTLVNAIAEVFDGRGDRVIVSEVPGTTRDSVDVRFEKDGKTLIVIDTAGVRKKRHMVTNDVEFYSFHRAQRSIRRADVVMMLIDGTERVSEPDKKLAQYIAEQQKPVVLVVNKWDLVVADAQRQAEERKTVMSSELLMKEYAEYLNQELRHLDYAPIAYITAKDGRKVQQVLDVTQHLFKQANDRVPTHRVNEAVRAIMAERGPSTRFGRRARVYYATQTDVAPPTIVLFVNKPEYLNDSYQRFMVNRFRELLPYPEVPIKLVIRERQRNTPDESGDGSEQRPPPARRAKMGAKPAKARRTFKPAPSRSPAAKAAAAKANDKPVRTGPGKRPPDKKPHPKSMKHKGPSRGARPH